LRSHQTLYILIICVLGIAGLMFVAAAVALGPTT
jgi:hypothetical protein